MKSGTTGLYDDLATHPRLYLPRIKEPSILLRSTSSAAAEKRYRKHFAGAPLNSLAGEASTDYTKLPLLPDVSRLALDTLGPELKLVYMMRNPVERIRSHLSHDYFAGRIAASDFDRLVWDDPRYLAFSDYALQLAPWVKAFGLGNILCLAFEDYVSDRLAVVHRVARFIGVDPACASTNAAVSNRQGSQRVGRFRFIGSVLRSDLYRYGVARVVPRSWLDAAKRMTTTQRSLPPVDLSERTRDRIASRFADLSDRLERLGVGRFQWG